LTPTSELLIGPLLVSSVTIRIWRYSLLGRPFYWFDCFFGLCPNLEIGRTRQDRDPEGRIIATKQQNMILVIYSMSSRMEFPAWWNENTIPSERTKQMRASTHTHTHTMASNFYVSTTGLKATQTNNGNYQFETYYIPMLNRLRVQYSIRSFVWISLDYTK